MNKRFEALDTSRGMLFTIQFLRGIAAVMVVMTHVAHKGNQYGTSSLNWFNIGGSGVDLFFIISGFIMCYTTHNKKITPANFIKNRISRIIPLYWALSFLALLVFIIAPNLVNSSGGETGIIESFFLIPSGVKFLIQNGWTLSFEFYFYIIFSAFIFLTNKPTIRYIGISSIILTLAMTGVICAPTNSFATFLTNQLLLEFSLGIIGFYCIKNFKFNGAYSILLITTGLLLLIYKNFHGSHDFIFERVITIGLPMFFVFVGLVSLESFFAEKKGVVKSAFEYIGDISYSTYLVHPFALSALALLLKKMNLVNEFIFPVILISGAIISGSLVYHWFEMPVAKLIKEKRIKKINSISGRAENLEMH